MKKFLLVLSLSFIAFLSNAQTRFAAMGSSLDESKTDATQIGVTTVRNHVSISTGGGVRQMVPGFQYVTNFCWGNGELPKSISEYEAKLKSLVATMTVKPLYAVIENEENMFNDNELYFQMYLAAKRVFDPLKIPVVNGGITDGAAVVLACDYYKRIGDLKTADYLTSRNKKGSQRVFASVSAEVKFLRTLPDSFFCFHYQLKDSSYAKDLQLIVKALGEVTGKIVINNELAQRDYKPATTTAMVKAAKIMRVVVLYMTTGNLGNAATFTSEMKEAARLAILSK